MDLYVKEEVFLHDYYESNLLEVQESHLFLSHQYNWHQFLIFLILT
jgi:hypothetical protein